MIRILRSKGYFGVGAAIGSLMAAMAAAGVFRLGGTIVGKQAFRLHEGPLGLRYSFDQAAQTNDIDIASFEHLGLALEDVVSEPLQKLLGDFAFDPIPDLEKTRTWRRRQTSNELLVEFLTPSSQGDEGLRPLEALGVHARSLYFLNFLIAEPIKVALPYRSGVLVQIPRPERFAVHKMIITDRRAGSPNTLKSVKDRMQVEILCHILLEDCPDDLREAQEDALERGPAWRRHLAATLSKMPNLRNDLKKAGIAQNL